MRKNKGKSIGACLHNHTNYVQNPDKTAQEYDHSQPEQPYDFVGLILETKEEGKTFKVQQRNHFKVGEVLEYLTPKGDVGQMTVGSLVNSEGETVDKAPHPLEELTLTTDAPLLPYTILRRRAK